MCLLEVQVSLSECRRLMDVKIDIEVQMKNVASF